MPSSPVKCECKGFTAIQLIEVFPDNDTAEASVDETHWRGKPTACSFCNTNNNVRENLNRNNPLPYHYGACRRHFSVRANSIMHSSKIGFQQWAIVYYLWAVSLKGLSSMQSHRELGITQESAYLMGQRLRTVFESQSDKMFEPVEVDENFYRGKQKNLPKEKRDKLEGRGTVGKSVVIGVTGRETGKIVALVTANVIPAHVGQNVDSSATIYTIDSHAYKGLKDYKLDSVNHSVSKYVRKQSRINLIESFWSLLKGSCLGTFHHFSPKHLRPHVNEFGTRQTFCRIYTIDMIKWAVICSIGQQLTNTKPIAKP